MNSGTVSTTASTTASTTEGGTTPPEMTSTKPYIVRALIEWCEDNNCTPYITVVVDISGVIVPMGSVIDGIITLDVSEEATHDMNFEGGVMTFTAGFRGKSEFIQIPVNAISHVFAKETGCGHVFEVTEVNVPPTPTKPRDRAHVKPKGKSNRKQKPFLTVVK